MYYTSRMIAAICVAALAAAAWWSVQWARADAAYRQQTPEGLAQAVNIVPLHRTYSAAAAIQAEYDGADPTPILTRIAAQHPRASSPRLQLGLAAEIGGNVEAAERWLLDAYAVDKMYETRWTLANFYFRQGREDDFWVWIQRALEISYGDGRPAFELCWRASQDATLILERAIPRHSEAHRAYVWYLLDTKRVDAAGEAANRLAVPSSPAIAPPVLAAIDTLLNAGRFEPAVRVWDKLRAVQVAGVTNGNFAQPPLDAGFDWRPVRNAGVTHTLLDAGRGYRIRLSGNQPEQCDLLRQWLGGLQPGKRYRLRWAVGDAPPGVLWRIAGTSAGLAANELSFTAPAEAASLVLAYARPPGEVRAEAAIDLTRVWLE